MTADGPTTKVTADQLCSPAEINEWKELRALKAWRSPRYRELDRKVAARGSYLWRMEDVWGITP